MVSSFVVIPARGGSKGIKNKNLIRIKEKSLTVRSIVHATTITEKKNIILSTDSKEIVENIAEFFGITNYKFITNQISEFGPFKIHFRDGDLSSDEALITEVLLSVRNLLLEMAFPIDLLCLLQPTTPFRSHEELLQIKEFIGSNGDRSTSLVSVCLVEDMHPARMYTELNVSTLEELKGFSEYRACRRQDLPEVFIRDGGFYIIGSELITEKLQYSKQPMSFKRKFPWSINIDGPADLLIAQNIQENELSNDPNERFK